jgi:hypothetical protein
MDKAQEIIKDWEFHNAARQNNVNYWQNVANFCHPRKAWINTIRLPGEPLKLNRLYDSTAVRSARVCAAGMYSNLINPATEWHTWVMRDYQYNDSYENRRYFKWLEKYIYSTLINTNFYNINLDAIHDSVVFGTGAVFTQWHPIKKIQSVLFPLDQLCLERDNYGEVCAFWRKFEWTANQAYKEWGEASPKCVRDAIQAKKNYDKFEFIHYCGERKQRDVTMLNSKNMPYEEFYVSVKDKYIITESGYEEFPLSVGNFYSDPADPFGFGAAMVVLAEVMGINYKHWAIDRAAAKAIDPAYLTPADGFQTPLNGNPGRQNFYDRTKVNASMLTSLPFHGNIPIGIDNVNRDAEAIKEGFFVHLFQPAMSLDNKRTAFEIQQRVAEGMQLLAPVVGRKTQFIGKQLKRILSILARHYPGDFALPPTDIAGKSIEDLDVNYQSPLIKAQKLSSVNSLTSFLSMAQQIVAVVPETQDKIIFDSVIDVLAEGTSVDPSVVRDDKEVKAIRDNRAQQQAQIAQLQQAQVVADIAQKGTAAAKTGAEADNLMAGVK